MKNVTNEDGIIVDVDDDFDCKDCSFWLIDHCARPSYLRCPYE